MNPNSSMQTLPRIPIPFNERWREIRLRTLPIAAFGAAVVAIVVLWRLALAPATLVGQVELITSTVSSPVSGVLLELNVARFQIVKKGTPLGVILPNDPRTEIDLMRADLENQRARMDPQLTERGFDVKLQRLRVPVLQQKVNLATKESDLASAKVEATRAEALFKTHAMTQQAYEALKDKERSLQAGIVEQKKVIADLEAEINKLEPPQMADANADPFAALLKAQEKKLLELTDNLGPVTLVAPIDGMVSVISRRAGENVAQGESILVISAQHTDNIIGYLREPFPMEPEVGMSVQIQTRGTGRKICISAISRVGSEFEDITNPHLHPTQGVVEIGVPIAVTLPASLNLRPGELVDLTLIRK